MAWTTRWHIYTVNPATGNDVDVYIQERDYSGSTTVLDPGSELVTIRYSPIGMFSGTPHWTTAASEATIEFIDDGTGQLIDVLSGDDEKYRVRITEDNVDEWYGFVVPDSYGFTPYDRGIATITATDRLGTLSSAAYLQSTGYVYSGRQSVIGIIANCLSPIASALEFSTHMQWYPYIGTNDLDATDNPLANLFIDNEIFYDDDGNPMSCGFILEQICGRFQLQLFQARGRWHFIQRRRSVTAGEYTVFDYTAAGAADSPTTSDLVAYVSIDGTTNRLVQPYATGTVPYGSVSTTYFHGNPFTDLFANRSFEDVLHGTVTGTPLANSATAQTGTSLIIDGLSASASIPAGMKFSIAGQDAEYELAAAVTANGSGQATLTLTFGIVSAVADNTAITFLEDVGNWQYDSASGDFASVPTASDGAIGMALSVDFETSPFSYTSANFLRQRSREQVAGGSGFRIQGGWDVNVPNLDDVTTELYMAFRAYIDVGGTNYYYKWSDSTWTTTSTINEIPLASYNLGNNRFDTFTFTTGELDDTGTPLTGYFYFEFLEGHEFNGGGSATTGLSIIIDNFQQPVLIDANYLPAGDATQTTITYDGNVNRSKPDATQFIIGDGPTTAHVKRLTVTDSTGAVVGDITGDWAFGPATLASGYTLDQFWADELLKQYRRSARVLSTGVHSIEATAPYKPWMMLRIENTNNTTEPDYWWSQLEYRPATPWNVASGTWNEVVQGTGGNLLCEYSVQGSSVAALSLTLEQGIPCATGGTSIAPSVPSGTLFFTTEASSSNSLITGNSLMRRDPDGTVVLLNTFTGSEPTALCLDPGNRYVFVVQGLKIWRFLYDGTDGTMIKEESGFTSIGGIDFIESGTYAGQLVYSAMTTPGTTNDDMYRLTIDGVTRTKISNNQYTTASGGVVVTSGTEVWSDANFSGASIVSYGLAGTSYTAEHTTTVLNNPIGIAADISGNRVWVHDSSTLKETNLSGTAYTDRTGINNGSLAWWDATGARLFYGGSGIRYRAGAAINTELTLTPSTGGSGESGAYGTNQIVAVQ